MKDIIRVINSILFVVIIILSGIVLASLMTI